jgi:hypothetical protein
VVAPRVVVEEGVDLGVVADPEAADAAVVEEASSCAERSHLYGENLKACERIKSRKGTGQYERRSQRPKLTRRLRRSGETPIGNRRSGAYPERSCANAISLALLSCRRSIEMMILTLEVGKCH